MSQRDQRSRDFSQYLLPPSLRTPANDSEQWPEAEDTTGDDGVMPVVQSPRDFARGGQPGSLRPTGRQAGLQQVVSLLVPYLDQTLNGVGFQPVNVPVPRFVSDGICDLIYISMGKSANSTGTPYIACSVDMPVASSNVPQLGGGCVAIAQFYETDLTFGPIRVQPGRHYVEAVAVFGQAQGGVNVLTPVSVTFINTRGLF